MNLKWCINAYSQGCGIGVGVARSRGSEPGIGVGVGANQAALTPTPKRLLYFVVSLAHAVLKMYGLSGKKCFFLNNNNCWPLYDNCESAYFHGHLSASLVWKIRRPWKTSGRHRRWTHRMLLVSNGLFLSFGVDFRYVKYICK